VLVERAGIGGNERACDGPFGDRKQLVPFAINEASARLRVHADSSSANAP
jgi:hypothetical protein